MSDFGPDQSPQVPDHSDVQYEYAGFWVRALATLGDNIVCSIVGVPFLLAGLPLMYGLSLVGIYDLDKFWRGLGDVWQVATAIFVITLWVKCQGTPCKRLLKLKILDADTRQPLTVGKAIIRYVAYIPSILVLFLGFVWVAFDKKKQGWHDKLANSVVVKEL